MTKLKNKTKKTTPIYLFYSCKHQTRPAGLFCGVSLLNFYFLGEMYKNYNKTTTTTATATKTCIINWCSQVSSLRQILLVFSLSYWRAQVHSQRGLINGISNSNRSSSTIFGCVFVFIRESRGYHCVKLYVIFSVWVSLTGWLFEFWLLAFHKKL